MIATQHMEDEAMKYSKDLSEFSERPEFSEHLEVEQRKSMGRG